MSINGHSLDNRSVDDVADEMQQLEGMVTFQLIRQSTSSTKSRDQSKVRTKLMCAGGCCVICSLPTTPS